MLKLLSYLYKIIVDIRNKQFDSGKLPSYRVENVEIICIGNITAGGTGKTPAVSYFVEKYKKEGKKIVIVSGGYGGKRDRKEDPIVVYNGEKILSDVYESGDEAQIHVMNANVPVIVGKNRYEACLKAVEIFKPDMIILDDGFQHRKLKRDKNIVLIDATNPFGGGHTLPYGRLRESLEGLKRADELIITKYNLVEKDKVDEIVKVLEKYNKPISYAKHCEKFIYNEKNERLSPEELRGKRIMLVSGIANPINFEKSIRKYKGEITTHLCYGDHFLFKKRHLKEILSIFQKKKTEMIVTTEKDYVKFIKIARENNIDISKIFVMKIEFEIKEKI